MIYMETLRAVVCYLLSDGTALHADGKGVGFEPTWHIGIVKLSLPAQGCSSNGYHIISSVVSGEEGDWPPHIIIS